VALIGVNASVGSAMTLVIPTIFGRSVDSILAGTGCTRWLLALTGLMTLGIVASIVDALVGAACVGPAAMTAVAAIAPPVGSLVLLALIDPWLTAAFSGGVLLVIAAQWAKREEYRPEPDIHALVTWRILKASGAQAAVVCPLVFAVGGLQVVNGRISAGDLIAASLYAVLGAGLGNLTASLGRDRPRVKSSCRTAVLVLRSTSELPG